MKYESFLRDGMLCWTLTTNGYKFLTWNFVLHWRKNVPNQPILVICGDKPSYDFLTREGISCRLADTLIEDFGPGVVAYGTKRFHTVTQVKLATLESFAKDPMIERHLYIDGDIIVYKNIADDMRTRLNDASGANLLMPCDHGPECKPGVRTCMNLCTGIVGFRHGVNPEIFQIHDKAAWDACLEDQGWVNTRLWSILDQPVGVLPKPEYANGPFVKEIHSDPAKKAVCICLHYNYRIGAAKKAAIKQYGDWLLPY